MTLGDLSNAILTELQQPGASFTVGGGGGPNWSAVSNAQFGQGLVEFWINEGYKKALGDLEDLALVLVQFTLTSTVNTFKYAIPPANYAPISHVTRVYYQPSGLPYTQEFRQGTEFISWAEFQKYTAQGYLEPYAFGTQPSYVTVDPLLANLYFYPGSAVAGDTITVQYSPIPAKSATGCPTLVNQNDVPLLPTDTHTLIMYFALSRLFMRQREHEVSLSYYNPNLNAPGLYQQEMKVIRNKYTLKHAGDTIRVEPPMDGFTLGLGPCF